MEKNLVELLAPAGSYESMVAAMNGGADAVYLGGKQFGARAFANNLDSEHLKRAIDYAHLHDRKLYLTVNTLLKEWELEEELYSYLNPLYQQGLDAVIVQDLGVLSFIRECFPDLPIHASTQMALTGAYGARMLKNLGAERIVTARELSLEEISAIHKEVEIEMESFIHGALCYCYSGQCLFSSLCGGRSGNRGRCAQPCRLPYEAGGKQSYLLSPRDMAALELLPDIIEAGICSLKIEGRMKKPEYTAGVTSIYRKYLDYYLEHGRRSRYQVDKADKKTLFDIYNRGEFTSGYYTRHNGRDMMFLKGREAEDGEKNLSLMKQIREDYLDKELKVNINGKVSVYRDCPSVLELSFKDSQLRIEGERAEASKSQPLTEEKIEKQIKKTGNTPFCWEELSVETDGKSFLSVTGLNELRREGMECLKEAVLKPCRRQAGKPPDSLKKTEMKPAEGKNSPLVHVYLEKTEYLEAFLSLEGIDALYLDSCSFGLKEIGKANGYSGRIYYVLPHIFREKEARWLDSIYEELLSSGIWGFVVKNYDELQYLKEKRCPLKFRYDYTLYGYNRRAREALSAYCKPECYTLPVELNQKELKGLGGQGSELLVYGYLPMMVSAQCVKKNTRKCDGKPELTTFTDRYYNVFSVKNQCRFCYNRIYNCKPLSLLTVKEEALRIQPDSIRLDFTLETTKEALSITRRFQEAYCGNAFFGEEPFDFTRGHFKRGIE